MKTTIFSTFILLASYSFSQENLDQLAVKKGDIILEAYYGSPDYFDVYYYISSSSFRESRQNNNQNHSVKRIAPIGVRGEYLLTNRIGIGFNLGYQSISWTGLMYKSEYEVESQDVEQMQIGLIPTFNYHFMKREKLDVYFNIGFGLEYTHLEVTSSSPTMYHGKRDFGSGTTVLGFGARYFFTNHFGVSSNLQLGQGGLISGGITYKF